MTWTHVAVAADESADAYPSGCIWNARGQLLPAAPACYQTCAWDTYGYARVRCVASQVRHQMNDLTRSIGRVHRVLHLVRPWHTLGKLERS